MELLERDEPLEALQAALDEAGGIVVVAGEAGIGKTALVSAALGPRRVLWGACDPLITPRPLGPLRDVARHTGGALAGALESGSREAVLSATLHELGAPAVLVVEDLHWADDATLDFVALLGRRLEHGSLVVTCRGDARPEVRRVLAALGGRRLELEALSPDAVARLAERAGRDAGDLHAVSGGNPFFVTEVLAAPAGAVPASVRDAVALRLALLSDEARAAIELAAVVPGPAELWLVGDCPDECFSLLTLEGDRLAFRHDLARRAVEDDLSPLRARALHRRVLAALEARGADPARLAHHARQAQDAAAIRRLAPAAARAASQAGGHRQALEQWEAALAAHEDAETLEGVAIEAYLCGRSERALAARHALRELHIGDPLAAGDDLRWLSRILWWAGRGQEAAVAADEAIAVLEAFPDSRELAMALSGRSQLAMLAERSDEAIAVGSRAVALARRIGARDIVAHGLTNVGTARICDGDERGRTLLEEAFTLAVEAGEDDHAARALVNLATMTLVRRRDDRRVAGDVDRALAFAREHELDGYVQYMLGVRAGVRLLRGEWPAAERDARASLAFEDQPGVSLCPALTVLGRLQARRGEPDATATLDDAWRKAVETGELQRLGPVAASRAEHAWLDGDLEGAAAAVRDTYELAIERRDPWTRAELAFWLARAGTPVAPAAGDPAPYALASAGDWRGAAAAWAAAGFPYERALTLADAGDEAARLEALSTLDDLGAVRVASHLRRRLRAAGVRRIPRGPRPASRAGVAGLTPRETEVLELVAQGATNAQIAQALVITPKTVDHHVSAVLAKLGVRSRRDAGAAARRLADG